MRADKSKKAVSGATKKVLDTVLKLEANSGSCVVLYQPKAPKGLSNFKKK